MAKNYFIPDREPELIVWLTNFKNKIPTQGAILGLTAGQIAELQNQCDEIITGINNTESAKRTAQDVTNAKNQTKKINLASMRLCIKNMKSTTSYTEAIGEDLGIVGDENDFDPLTFKTKLKAVEYTDHVEIQFVKSKTDGVNIYSRLKGAATWTFLAYDTSSPYIDNRPLTNPGTPETREYMGIGVIDDTQLPLQSDILTVVFG